MASTSWADSPTSLSLDQFPVVLPRLSKVPTLVKVSNLSQAPVKLVQFLFNLSSEIPDHEEPSCWT